MTVDLCKVCGRRAELFVQFGMDQVFPETSGLAPGIDYFRCLSCGFLYSRFLDGWSDEQLRRLVYRDGFHKGCQDPQLLLGGWLAQQIPRPDLRVLDYGCGTGTLLAGLRQKGFAAAEGYDPHAEPYRQRPEGRFSLVICQEVLEHMPDPDAGMADIAGFLASQGFLLFTTLVQPPDIEHQRADWWYLTPQTGHVSLHSPASLDTLLTRHGLVYRQLGPFIHSAHWRG